MKRRTGRRTLDARSAGIRWWSRAESLEGSWPAQITRPVNLPSPWIRVSVVPKRDVVGRSLNEGPVKEEPFTAAPTSPVVPLLCGISPFRRSALSAIIHSWWKSKQRKESSSGVRIRSVDIVLQNKGARYLCLPSIIFFCVKRRCIN